MEELKSFSEMIVKGLLLRQRYMNASLQEFYKPTARYLSSVSAAGVGNLQLFEKEHDCDVTTAPVLKKKKSVAGNSAMFLTITCSTYTQTINIADDEFILYMI